MHLIDDIIIVMLLLLVPMFEMKIGKQLKLLNPSIDSSLGASLMEFDCKKDIFPPASLNCLNYSNCTTCDAGLKLSERSQEVLIAEQIFMMRNALSFMGQF